MFNIGFDANIRRYSELCFLNNCISSVKKLKDSKKTTMKVLQLLLLGNENFKNRSDSKNYISLTAKEISEILGKRESEIQSILDTLSKTYASMYNMNNTLVGRKDNRYFYIGKYNDGWNRLGYFFPSLGKVNISYDEIANSDGKIHQDIMVAVFVLASEARKTKFNLTFRYEHIRNILGLTIDQFKSVCKKNDFNFRIKFSETTTTEKRLTNINNNSRIRGIYFTNEAIDNAKKLLLSHSFQPEWRNIHRLGEMMYLNQTHISKDFFTDVSKEKWNTYTYTNNMFTSKDLINQDRLYYVEDESSCSKNSKKALDLEIKNSIIHSEEYYKNSYAKEDCKNVMLKINCENEMPEQNLQQDMDTVELNSGVTTPQNMSEQKNKAVSFKNVSYQDFCYESREKFTKMKEEKNTQNCVFNIISDYIEIMDNDVILCELKKIKTIADVLKSTMFTHPNDCANNHKLLDNDLKGKWDVIESLLFIDENDYIDEILFFEIFGDIKDDFSNLDEWVSSELRNEVDKKFDGYILNKNQIHHIENFVESQDSKQKKHLRIKQRKDCAMKMSPIYLLHKYLGEKTFNSKDELAKYVRSNSSYTEIKHFNHAILNQLYGSEFNDIEKWLNVESVINFELFNNYFDIKFEVNETHISNVDLISEIINSLKTKKTLEELEVNEERNSILELISSLGMNVGSNDEIKYEEVTVYEMELKMGVISLDDIKKDLLSL